MVFAGFSRSAACPHNTHLMCHRKLGGNCERSYHQIVAVVDSGKCRKQQFAKHSVGPLARSVNITV